MTTQIPTGGAQPDAGSAGSETQTPQGSNVDPVIEGYKTDMFKFKNLAKQRDEENQTLRAQLKAVESQSLKEKEDFKTLWETTAKENEELRRQKDSLVESVTYSEKFRAIYPALKKVGLKDEALKYVENHPLTDLEIETTSQGRFIVRGADSWAEKFKAENPLLFQSAKPANINTGGGGKPDLPNQDVTPQMITTLEQQWRRSGKPEDRQAYENAYRTYAQKRKA